MSGKTLALVFLVASVSQIDAGPKKKEPGMTYIGHFSGGKSRTFQGSDYYISDNAATWTIANNNCKAIFGDIAGLVSLESEDEKNSLNIMLEDYGAGITYWTSGIYDPSGAVWRWASSNTPIGSWAPWGTGYPGSPTSVSRLAILYLNQFSANWVSIFNTQKHLFICEVGSTSIPSTEPPIVPQSGVCQIRLDFVKFQIAEHADTPVTGNCDADALSIYGHSNAWLGNLCGNLDGQHTPTGCVQYFTGVTGTVKSLNFNLGHQLNIQDYVVCTKPNPGMNKIEWKSCGGDKDFGISGETELYGPGVGGESGDSCTRDWVMIYGLYSTKYCCAWFPDSVKMDLETVALNVHFDYVELEFPSDPNIPVDCTIQSCDWHNQGFCLTYTQTVN
ncbi:C-type lectin domain family 6 member A [Folsomia candida]|uniref:C-type lectin domain family 6 member A n=1 Tax=Folsomia candida TaxID=158441 RepID=A0A226EDE1_FOLCA|nr:C-type lectin domain family 6 member A [Folsomia candida]